MAGPMREAHAEVVGFQEAGRLAGLRGEVGQPQVAQHQACHPGGRGRNGCQVQVRQRVHVTVAALAGQAVDRPEIPSCLPRLPGVGEQRPLDLRASQRPQAPQVDLPGPRDRRLLRAPGPELRFVAEDDGNRLAGLFEPARPRPWQQGTAGPVVVAVAGVVPRAQAQRRTGHVRAGRDLAAAVAGVRYLAGEPHFEVSRAGLALVLPAAGVPLAQPPPGIGSRP